MTKTTQAIIVAAGIIVTAVITIQTVRHHYRSPDSSRMSQGDRVLLPSQPSLEAEQVARDFFEAFKDEDWNAVARYWPLDCPKGRRFEDVFTEQMKGYVSGLEIVSLGKPPYKEGPNSWVLVPYAIRMKSGNTQTNSLRLGRERDGQWHFEGGF